MLSETGEMTLCVMALFDRYGDDFCGPQQCYRIRHDGEYYDLFDAGGLCCMDGETVIIEDFTDESIEVVNAEGSVVVHMGFFDEQFETATGISANEARQWFEGVNRR